MLLRCLCTETGRLVQFYFAHFEILAQIDMTEAAQKNVTLCNLRNDFNAGKETSTASSTKTV